MWEFQEELLLLIKNELQLQEYKKKVYSVVLPVCVSKQACHIFSPVALLT